MVRVLVTAPAGARVEAPVSKRKARSTPTTKADGASGELTVSSSEGETNVRVVGPEQDAIAGAWLRASNAYYEARDLEAAIQIASGIVEGGGQRPEVKLAEEMLCEAFIATQQPRRAIEACTALLEDGRDEEAERAVHYRLATIYRTQLSDCRSAVRHYGRAMVFGRRSMLDDEVLLGRAHCLLDLGDLAGAKSDIAILESRAGALARALALVELKRRLDAIAGSRAKSKD
jgi:hypothetical protein